MAGHQPLTPAATPYSASSTPAAGGVPGSNTTAGSSSDVLGASTPREQQDADPSRAGGHTAQAARGSGTGLAKAEATREEDLSRQEANEQEQERKRAEQLQRALLELPPIARQHLVPLYEIVRRVIARAYSELQSLVEV